jgi:glycosyltransferase involved in cell wall biosynthesis/GT2 family glycosyltransferase
MGWDTARTVSVVVCAYTPRRWALLVACLASLAAQDEPPRDVTLVVDHDDELLRRCRAAFSRAAFTGAAAGSVTVVANDEARGLSGARNTGVRHGQGDVVAFIDDDAVAPTDWCRRLLGAYEPDVAAVGGGVRAVWPDGRPGWFPPAFDWVIGCSWTGLPVEPAPVRNLIGANMSVRRPVLAEVDAFAATVGRVGTRPTGCEETELCIRIGRRWPDARILYVPDLVVDHHISRDRTTPGYFVRRCWAEGRSKAIVTRAVGAGTGLASERRHASRVIPAAVAESFRDAGRGAPGAFGRAAALTGGLAITTAGFAAGRAVAPRRGRRAPARRGASSGAVRSRAGPLRVLMVTPRYLPETGGVEQHVFEVARRLGQHGCVVTVLCTDRTHGLRKRERDGDVTIQRVRAWPRGRDYYLAPALWWEITDGEWDVVHVQSYHTFVAPLAMLRAQRLRVPYVVTFHGGGHSSRARHALRPIQRRALGPLLRRAAQLVAVARFEIDDYGAELGVEPDRFTLIPNGAPAVAPAPARNLPHDGAIVVASIGRLERYKGHHLAVDAFPHVLRAHPDARLWIVGEGPDLESLRAQVARLGLEGNVEFRMVPPKDREAMLSLIASTSAVVSLSRFETHPLAAVEAIAAGRPLVVADTSGLRELADQGLARAVPLDASPESVAAAIVDALRERRVPAPAPDLPTWDDCASRLNALYRRVACVS